jgi:hypothetical protein
VRPTSGANLFANMIDSLHPLFPEYQGYWASTMSTDTGDIIDHAWLDRRYLIPLKATNEILTLRGIEDDMWDISDLSDHRTNWGRFSFPDVAYAPVDTSLCPGDALMFSVTAIGTDFGYQWFLNGNPISGATGPNLALSNLQPGDVGTYNCLVSYTAVHGTKNDPVNTLFYPNGPDTVAAQLNLEGWAIDLDCGVGADPVVAAELRVFPNPASERVRVELVNLPPKGRLLLRDVYGGVLMDQALNRRVVEVDLAGLSSGVYLLEVVADGRRVAKRLVVE